jgi:spermidine synthase
MLKAVRFDDNTRVNSDLDPACYRISLQIWLSRFPGIIENFYRSSVKTNIIVLMGSIIAIASIFKYFYRKGYSRSLLAATIYVGAGAMISQMLLIYIFQAVFGNIYYWMGLLTALFMGGMAMGGYAATRHIRLNPSTTAYSLLCLALIFLVLLSSGSLTTSGLATPLLCVIFSFLTGVFFVDVVDLSKIGSQGLKAAAFYSADLIGGAIAAIATILMLIPAYGLVDTMAVLCSLYIGSVILTAHSS